MITKQDAKEAAEKGLVEALKCSIKHHEDGRDMTSLELQNAYKQETFTLGTGLCALCWIYCCGRCKVKDKECPLYSQGMVCCEEYYEADNAIKSFDTDPSNANHTAFVEAERKMIVRLEAELSKVLSGLEKVEKKKAKPELRHGDYGDNGRNIWIKIYDKVWWLDGNQTHPSLCPDSTFIENKLGNLLDDLKNRSKK